MVIKSILLAATVVFVGASAASAQSAGPAVTCAKVPCDPKTARGSAPATPGDASTEAASSDPMSAPSDKTVPPHAATTKQPGRPPTYPDASMPARTPMPSGDAPGSPTAPSPMPGAGS